MLNNFGEIISTRRKQLNLTLEELSQRTGISVVSLGKIENGQRLPTASNLNIIAESLELDYDEIYEVAKQEKESRKQ